LLTGLWNLKEIQNSRQNRSKNKLIRENAVTRTEVARSGLWAPGYVVVIPELTNTETSSKFGQR